MKRFHRFSARKFGVLFASVLLSTGGLGLITTLPSFAQETFELTGTLVPAEDEYQFEGVGGQTVSISMTSEEFDTLLVLLGPDGEEVAMNDDDYFDRSLNSKIVTTLPTDGTYTIIAKSFGGRGGDYVVSVQPATEFETAYAQAVTLSLDGDLQGAIAAYSEAIAIDDSQPAAYLSRAEAYFNEAYQRLGEDFGGPEDLADDVREAIASDYESAADIYEAQGEPDFAISLRDQATYIRTGEYPEYPEYPS
ncbi:MAG: tetratricopeptide repeat protein [Cyanobacteria bacterium P01_A01_bin.123]